MGRHLASAVLLCVITVSLFGEDTEKWENPGYVDGSPILAEFLGLTITEVIDRFGAPAEIFPFRGDSEEQDTVVFFYDNGLYFFWFRNRVWQVRADNRFTEQILGLSFGMGPEEVRGLIGSPFYRDEESSVYNLPDQGVPVRMRLFFTDGKLDDIYIYRSDF